VLYTDAVNDHPSGKLLPVEITRIEVPVWTPPLLVVTDIVNCGQVSIPTRYVGVYCAAGTAENKDCVDVDPRMVIWVGVVMANGSVPKVVAAETFMIDRFPHASNALLPIDVVNGNTTEVNIGQFKNAKLLTVDTVP
jgi:hypothetical protein